MDTCTLIDNIYTNNYNIKMTTIVDYLLQISQTIFQCLIYKKNAVNILLTMNTKQFV